MAKIWQLSANYSGLTARGTINGFPVFRADTAGTGESGFATAPLNPFLVGNGNVLRIEVTEKGADASLHCSIEDAMTGDIIDTGNAKEIPLPEGEPPHVIELTFDSETDDFRKLLEQLRPSTAEVMTDFAITLRDALNAGDVEKVMKLFTPKFETISRGFGHPLDKLLQQARGMLEVFAGKNFSFEAADVVANPCCDDRLWELKNRNGNALIRIQEGDDVMSLDVCAAQLPEGVAVVI